MISVPPSWLVEPTDTEIAMGHNLSVHCSADGIPKPEIQWKKSMGLAHAQYLELNQIMTNYL